MRALACEIGLGATVDRVDDKGDQDAARKCRTRSSAPVGAGPHERMAFCALANFARTREIVRRADFLFRRRHTSQPGMEGSQALSANPQAAIAAEECRTRASPGSGGG